MEKIVIKNLYKVFGAEPRKGVKLLEQGKSKEEIYEQTGLTVAVQGASFTVNKGEIFVVMGLSGSGKSTLVRMLNRLIEPTSGEVLVDGQNILNMNKDELVRFRRSKTSMVFQSFALMPHQTVLENAAFGRLCFLKAQITTECFLIASMALKTLVSSSVVYL
ncbi:ATP-binding cassette domain-containing protein [Shewanella baltica]|uniref:ATP-binding cassette domain-containing protein n=1 Tax=Shewanella baltica TaxID=62322 RepID=UPI003D0071C9